MEDTLELATNKAAQVENLKAACVKAGLSLPLILGKTLLKEFPGFMADAADAKKAFRAGEPFALAFSGPRASLALSLFVKGAVLGGIRSRVVDWADFVEDVLAGRAFASFEEIDMVAFRALPDRECNAVEVANNARIGGVLSRMREQGLGMAWLLECPVDDLGIGSRSMPVFRHAKVLEAR